ncbi:STN domain-containing protein [Pseudarcicella hirudinis]|uniref:STN domain-containing protein n=1 Tax=Pseudarcicella hirudinis TaxID=1079859 RepID=UPI0035F0336E
MKKQRHFQKTLLYLMKISLIQVFIAVIFAGVSLAHGLSAQDLLNKKVTLRIDNKDIKSILRNIENAADVKFTYRPKLISIDQRISINANNEKLSEVLEKLLKPLNISWEIIGDQIILKKNFSEILP